MSSVCQVSTPSEGGGIRGPSPVGMSPGIGANKRWLVTLGSVNQCKSEYVIECISMRSDSALIHAEPCIAARHVIPRASRPVARQLADMCRSSVVGSHGRPRESQANTANHSESVAVSGTVGHCRARLLTWVVGQLLVGALGSRLSNAMPCTDHCDVDPRRAEDSRASIATSTSAIAVSTRL